MNLPSIAVHSAHNASFSVIHNDEIVCVIELERFLNKKNASWEFFEPTYSKEHVLNEVKKYLKSTFGFIKYDKFIVGEGYTEFPQIYKDIIDANEYIYDYFAHHSAHSLNALYQSSFEKALIISFDGGSLEGWWNVYIGEKGKDLEKITSVDIDMGSHYGVLAKMCEEIRESHILTLAGKLLGLQSYGEVVEEWKNPIKKFFKHIPYWKDIDERVKILSDEMGVECSFTNKLSGKKSYDFAKTVQIVFEEIFYNHMDSIIESYKDYPIIVAGGCAMNIVLNTNIKNRYNKEVFIAPNSSDCGMSVGLICKHFKPKNIVDITYKGIDILDKNTLIEYLDSRRNIRFNLDSMVEDLINQRIIGVVQGNCEHGPRSLGNRSIICSPIPHNMKDVLNLKVKHREWYRPFAPIVRLEDVSEYFEWEGESRWMNFCPKVKEEYRDKLPVITHIDGTARIQTITIEQNKFMYDLLTKFKEKTGIGVLVNTSFNVDGKPILSTYRDAFKIFDETQLDRLYLDGYYFVK
jgi:carbamoyltransferase